MAMANLIVLFALFLATFQVATAQPNADSAQVLRYAPQSRAVLSGAGNLELKARDQCHDEDPNICAEILSGGNVVQQIHLNDNGCTPLNGDITGINIYNCWCGLWSASDSGACNNGDDTGVATYNQCAGQQGGWQTAPNFISCYRP